MKTDLVAHPLLNGFYKHPHWEGIYLSKNGDVFDDNKRRFLNQYYSSKGYLCVDIDEKRRSVHRLMCETFLEVPEGIDPRLLVVNHINAVKDDNRIENLEWTDYRGNNLHAHRLGLQPQTTAILVKDINTGEIQRFYSLQDCARFFKVNGSKIFYYLKPNVRGYPCFDHYLIIREGDDWPELKGTKRLHQPVDIIVLDKASGQYIVFEGTRAAAEFVKLPHTTLYKRLTDAKLKGKTWYEDEHFGYGFLSLNEDLKELEVERRTWTNPRKVPPTPTGTHAEPVEVTDLLKNETKTYPSIIQLAEELGVKRNTLQAYLNRNEGIWKNRLKVKYLNSQRSYSSEMKS